jgi:hypothetical protein
MYSQGFYFETRAGDEVKIFGFYNYKQTNKQILVAIINKNKKAQPPRAGKGRQERVTL